jgi:hypothetical protein
MHYTTYWASKLLQLLDDILLAVTAMDNDCQVVVTSKGKVSIEPFLLVGERGVVPVSVEAGFADGDHTRFAQHVEDFGPVFLADFGRLVGVDADGGEDSPVSAGELEGAVAGLGGDADGDDLGDARGRGTIEDRRQVGAQTPVVQVSVGIDEWSGGGALGRGIHVSGTRGAQGAGLSGFRDVKGWPQSLQGNCLSILGLLDSPVNVVLNSKLGPGLENSFVGLGPSGAWLAPCAQIVVSLSGWVVPRRCCSLAHQNRKSEPCLGGRISGGLCLYGFDPVEEQAGAQWHRAHLGGDE